jgi:glycosyltransferase involved in cell wall biosynthesis
LRRVAFDIEALMPESLHVLGLCAYPVEAAATRFRLHQFVAPLQERGVDLTISPFLTSAQFHSLYNAGDVAAKGAAMAMSTLIRARDLLTAARYDLVFVQREAMIFGPGVMEWFVTKLRGMPMVLDLDDATYVRYVGPTYGLFGSWLKSFGKTDKLIERAAAVTCGNRFIAEYVERKGTRSVVVPTVVNLDEFKPAVHGNMEDPIVGWVGTHSTFPFLESIFPVLERLAKKHRFTLRIVGAGRRDVRLNGVWVENLDWNMEREPSDFSLLDIGLYPITTSSSANEEWIRGKSGFKAVQYLAVGVPFVMSPVGICAEMGEPGKTHFNAVTGEDWYNALNTLLSDEGLRSRMGVAGRAHVQKNYRIDDQADVLARTFRGVMG